MVQPEAVQEKTVRFRGPEFKSSNKKAGGGRCQKLKKIALVCCSASCVCSCVLC